MRPMRSLYLWCAPVLLSAAVGCGKDSSGPGGDANVLPTADFTSSCTNLACSFTDLSHDADGVVKTYGWQFGDGNGSAAKNPNHTFTEAGDFQVTLTVTDDSAGQGTKTKTVTVSVPQNGAPAANFTASCSALDCTFTDTSTDDGNIVSWAWEFGDGATSADQSPTHHYDATTRTVYPVKLTVTDNDGASATRTTEITVSPAATLQCEDGANPGSFASCDLVLEADATVTVVLTDRSCVAHGNTFQITAPVAETLFTDGCYTPDVGPFALNGGAVFTAGTHLKAQVISGAINQVTAPALHVTGSYPTWTLAFDDGVGGPGEPDFNDLIITVTATPAQ